MPKTKILMMRLNTKGEVIHFNELAKQEFVDDTDSSVDLSSIFLKSGANYIKRQIAKLRLTHDVTSFSLNIKTRHQHIPNTLCEMTYNEGIICLYVYLMENMKGLHDVTPQKICEQKKDTLLASPSFP